MITIKHFRASLLLVCALSCGQPVRAEASPAKAVPAEKAVPIAVSRNMPVMGEAVMVGRLATNATSCEVADPSGSVTTLRFGADGKALWVPARHGPHQLRLDGKTRKVWVLASPLYFHWWEARLFPHNATHVMNIAPDSIREWNDRGVPILGWVVGEYAHRKDSGYNPPYSKPEQWVADWTRAAEKVRNENGSYNGFSLDEVFCANVEPNPAIIEAVALYRKNVGADATLAVYSGGAEKGFDTSAGLLKDSKALCMIESYWGDEDLFAKRWQDMKQYGLEKQTIFAIGPGFKLRADCHGPLTVEEVRAEFMKVRRVAPESPGIAIYNAFAESDRSTLQSVLDEACSQAIEDFYLKPVLFASASKHGEVRVAALKNIGNDDAKGFLIIWRNAKGGTIHETGLPPIRPGATQSVPAPAEAASFQLSVPEGCVNLLPQGVTLQN
jgi:hypothetical protein